MAFAMGLIQHQSQQQDAMHGHIEYMMGADALDISVGCRSRGESAHALGVVSGRGVGRERTRS